MYRRRACCSAAQSTSNLKFGGDHITDADAEQAAEIAQATEFISAKPEGFDSRLPRAAATSPAGRSSAFRLPAPLPSTRRSICLMTNSPRRWTTKTDVALRRALKAKTDNATVIIVAQRISTVLHAEPDSCAG